MEDRKKNYIFDLEFSCNTKKKKKDKAESINSSHSFDTVRPETEAFQFLQVSFQPAVLAGPKLLGEQ